jgi:hypothetical protein
MKYKVGDLLLLQLDTTIWDIGGEAQDYDSGQIFIVVSCINEDKNAYTIYSQQSCSFSQWHKLNAEQTFVRLAK